MAWQHKASRLKKELQRLTSEPPFGVCCWPCEDSLDCFEAKIQGGQDTPYEGGIFKLQINIPERYPFEPPQVKFVTKIYHPNIDTAGRICLDMLKSLPQGSWRPIQNISTVLQSIQLLLAEPNPDDGLMADISSEYKHNRPLFVQKAREWVQRYANEDIAMATIDDGGGVSSVLGKRKNNNAPDNNTVSKIQRTH